MRTTTLLLCLSLCVPAAGCTGANALYRVDGAPMGSSPQQEAAAPAPSAQARDARASGKKNDRPAQQEWWQEGGVTREKINAMCWMKYEKGRKDISIDKRADLVNDCVIQALKEHPLN